MLCPSGEKVASPIALSIGIGVGIPPSTEILYMFWIQLFHASRFDR